MVELHILTVKKKFAAVFVTVASRDEEHVCNDFTNKVHIKALKRNIKPKNVNRT